MANQKGDNVSTGHYFNRCTDPENNIFETYSFWHKASDCEFDDGTTAQEKLGAIKGILSSTNVTESGYAADAAVVSNLSNRLCVNNTDFIFDYQNGKYGYNTDSQRGADTFHPFSEIEKDKLLEALKYSGLNLDENSTADEIYAALRQTYPEHVILWGDNRNTDIYEGEPVTYGTGHSSGKMTIYLGSVGIDSENTSSYIEVQAISKGSSTYRRTQYVSLDKAIDVTRYKQLKLTITYLKNVDNLTFGLMNTSGSDNWKVQQTCNTIQTHILDITDYSGECFIGCKMSVEAPANDGESKTGTLRISQIELIA